MNLYPVKVSPISYLVGAAFKQYGKVLKTVSPFLLAIIFLVEVIPYLEGAFNNQIWHVAMIITMILLLVYSCSAALYAANAVLKGDSFKFNEVCKIINAKSASIYVGVFALVLGFCLLFFASFSLSAVLGSFFAKKTVALELFLLFLIAAPLTFFVVLFVFAIPLLVLERMQVWSALCNSVRLIGCRYWLHAFVVYASILIAVLVLLPETRHGHWLLAHHLNFVVDAVVLLFFIPLTINFMLLLINDLRLRGENT